MTTQDGDVFDPLTGSVLSILGGDSSVIRREDGLQFAMSDAEWVILTHHGVAMLNLAIAIQIGVYPLRHDGHNSTASFWCVLRVRGAVIRDTTALHGPIGWILIQRLTQRQHSNCNFKEFGGGTGELTASFAAVTDGRPYSPRRQRFHRETGSFEEGSRDKKGLKRTISGDAEAHLFAAELGAADVGVIFSPVRLFPSKWHQRGMSSTHGTKRRFSVDSSQCNCLTWRQEAWESRNGRFDATWVPLEAGLSEPHVLSLVRSNLERLLGA
ncbi:hypothetical protein BU17DRAFT_96806 [Hysterangium stoloniferum]|nr:hypothetical protein BU17DRAFT_96806 [Hysterangium stoloniferum]